jgi:hypothetical protein
MYVGTKHTVVASGETMKSVRCEKCGETYYYKMLRQAQGEGSSAYFLDESGASDRAARRAAKSLQRKLEVGCEAVACPDCRYFQPHMVALLRRRQYGWMTWLGIFLPLALLMGFGAWANKRHLTLEDDPGRIALGLLVPAVVAGAVFGLNALLSSRYDPNVVPPRLKLTNPRPMKLLNPPEEFSPRPATDLYFASPEDCREAWSQGQQVPLDSCLVQPAVR